MTSLRLCDQALFAQRELPIVTTTEPIPATPSTAPPVCQCGLTMTKRYCGYAGRSYWICRPCKQKPVAKPEDAKVCGCGQPMVWRNRSKLIGGPYWACNACRHKQRLARAAESERQAVSLDMSRKAKRDYFVAWKNIRTLPLVKEVEA